LKAYFHIFGLFKDLNAILKSKTNEKNWLCPIEPKILIWSRQLNDPNLKERFDFIISADWFVFILKFHFDFSTFIFSFFFEDLHHDLCHTIYYMLKDSVRNFIISLIRSIGSFCKGYFDKFCSISFQNIE
jgi:hypothetical protein